MARNTGLAAMLVVAIAGPGPAPAQTSSTQTAPAAQQNLPAAGQRRPASFIQSGATLASHGAGSVPACAGCHGQAGEGNAAAGFPRLAGQSADYLWKQLNAYAEGRRANPVMTPIASVLTPAQREAVARHFALLRGTAPSTAAPVAASPAAKASDSSAPAPAPERGRALATLGDESRQVQACANCHGPDGVGEAGGGPYLAGQPAAYLLAALQAWQNGSRRSDPSGQMPIIARALDPADAQAAANYFAALSPVAAPLDAQPPSPSARAGAAKRGRTVVSGPTRQTQPQGVGTEQGGPVIGGSSGIGGNAPNTGTLPASNPGRPGGAPAAR